MKKQKDLTGFEPVTFELVVNVCTTLNIKHHLASPNFNYINHSCCHAHGVKKKRSDGIFNFSISTIHTKILYECSMTSNLTIFITNTLFNWRVTSSILGLAGFFLALIFGQYALESIYHWLCFYTPATWWPSDVIMAVWNTYSASGSGICLLVDNLRSKYREFISGYLRQWMLDIANTFTSVG